ncbi:helix-turn-helix domain-containing protein [Faecalicatena sp. AGMB00832]|uniref:Helix-turn-helix domain-containing protein n=1 Tax=Faecalicatena faecalis TaxID=2726362 RepID=A0ABS6D451_9FIRM|nr:MULTISPECIES: helix-turn-helix transcriptional regulator [Faecalicatena]MBU3876367.1 helix-turn-helix domain-containing protein [Faecalicatena faecalis]MCI6464338.1 helix-turn-helix domain-containing protein [Faecalicatena sp.]MDY5621313.1 helix-turn-helix transcriptional regulator [Lachnospiraceae bacterium]
MPISTIIHDKRKELGLTQEKVADYLGVSTPAVNKWEKGTTFPDVTLLAPLARLLKIDMNVLFCFEEEITEQELGAFCMELTNVTKEEGLDSGFRLLEEKMHEYPKCGALIQSSAITLDGFLMMQGLPTEEKEKYEEKLIRLYQRAVEVGDEKVRLLSCHRLTSMYTQRGEYEKAREMLELIPEKIGIDKKQLESRLLLKEGKTDEAAVTLERSLLAMLNEVMALLMNLIECETDRGNHEAVDHAAQAWKKTAEAFGLWEYSAEVLAYHAAVVQKDTEATLSLLKKLMPMIVHPWDMSQTVLFRDMAPAAPAGTEVPNAGKQFLPGLISELTNNPMYDFLWENNEFRELIKQWRTD